MIRKARFLAFGAILLASAVFADWQNIAPGVDFQEFREANYDIFVTRVDLTNSAIAVISSRESEKGIRVSDFAKKVHAIVAINGDYFDDKFYPIGLTVGPCGEWQDAKRTKKEGYVAIGSDGTAKIAAQSDVPQNAPAEDWMRTTISGWPVLVRNCKPLTASQLPGSDSFTRSPHPRTAAGLSRDGDTLYLVVADGRRTGVPGLTLAQLASFMSDELNACSAINFDGGGSSAMWVSDHIVNRPADGVERPVGDHLAIVLKSDAPACDADQEARLIATMRAKDAATTVITTSTTTTKTTTTTTTQKPQTSSANPTPPPR